ncbi:MAG: ABC transporter permease [Patescibacteria group bacterium]|nr:ABC transporter permease [Patescibacteria group bacterium]
MRFRDTIRLSFHSLMVNKSRAVLTMLGIIIGVASVILMLSVGRGAEKYILSQVASFGSDLLFVRNGPGDGKQGAGPPTTSVKQVLTMDDYKKIRQQSWVTAAGANIYSSLVVEYQGSNYTTQISGTTESDIIIFNTEIESGSFMTSDDIDSKAHVAVLGHDIAQDLFGNEDPLNKRIKIKKVSYRVIGVMKTAGTKFFTNLDRQVYTPVTTLMQQLNIERLQFMTVKIGNTPPAEAQERIRILLREQHKLDNPTGDLAKDDFFVATQEDTMERAGIIGTILQILLTSIAAISLVVGGVGIMNIMYVTVTERTREIGLRKAIGAKSSDVLKQFLYEAILLSVLAGFAGVVIGVGVSYLGILLLQSMQSAGWTFEMPWFGIQLGFGVSAAIGIFFGYFPARTAAKLNPIEALRYE